MLCESLQDGPPTAVRVEAGTPRLGGENGLLDSGVSLYGMPSEQKELWA